MAYPKPEYLPELLGAVCSKCYLRDHREGGPVPPELHPGSLFTFVGEGPGETEVKEGRPFVGRSGLEMMAGLQQLGLERHQVDWQNAFACRPPGNKLDLLLHNFAKENKRRKAEGKEALPSPIACCRPRLVQELRNTGATNIVTLGGIAYQSLVQSDKNVQEVRGGPVAGYLDDQDNFWLTRDAGKAGQTQLKVLPTLHPAFVMRARRWTKTLRSDLGRAARWFTSTMGWRDPKITLNPSPRVLWDFLQTQKWFTCDVETDARESLLAKLRCIGIGTKEEGMCIHLRSIHSSLNSADQSPFYSSADLSQILWILKWFLTNPDILKVGHNFGSYDYTVILQNLGIVTAPILDTILMHKSAEPEMPHSLGHLGTTRTDITSWKADHTATETRSDEELGKYCLPHGAPVVLADGSTVPIQEIVNKKQAPLVLSVGPSGRLEPKRVVGWHRNRVRDQAWVQIMREFESGRGLIATPDHPVLTGRGQIPAGEVRRGDTIFLSEVSFTPEQRSAVLGTLLGDTILVVSPTHRKRRLLAPSAALSGCHSLESELVKQKIEFLAPHAVLGVETPGREIVVNGRRGNAGPSQAWRTGMLAQLRELLPMYYGTAGERCLSLEVLEQLGPIGLAWWFMDDGCVQKKDSRIDSITIGTYRYSEADVKATAGWLSDKFGAPVRAYADRVLRFSTKAAESFCELVSPHIFPKQRYKLPRQADWPAFVPVKPVASFPVPVKVKLARPYNPPRDTSARRSRAETRYCVDVEDNHNFFTPSALVHNCVIDCVVDARIIEPLKAEVEARDQVNIVQLDHQLQAIAAGMHINGMYVNQETRAWFDALLRGQALALLAGIQKCLSPGVRKPGASNQEWEEWREKHLAALDPEEREAWLAQEKFAKEYNPNSVEQVKDLFYTRWHLSPPRINRETGEPTTDDDAIRALMVRPGLSKQQKTYLELHRLYKRATKQRGTYTRKWVPITERIYKDDLSDDLDLVDEDTEDAWDKRVRLAAERETRNTRKAAKKDDRRGCVLADGRAHPGYNVHVVPTGRMSSSDPYNGQNVPDVLRWIFEAERGRLYVGADQDQLELRMAAGAWGLTNYIKEFENPESDPHTMTALMIFGALGKTTYEIACKLYGKKGAKKHQDWKNLRDFAKTFTYAVLYGAEDQKVWEIICSAEDDQGRLPFKDTTLIQTRERRRMWLNANPEIEKAWENTIEEWRRNHFLRDPVDGRRCDFMDGIGSDDDTDVLKKIINFRVQAGGRALVNRALVVITKEIPFGRWGHGTGLVNDCHDSVLLEVPEKEAEWVAKFVTQAMTMKVPGIPVQFKGNAKIGRTWAEV